MSHPVSSPFHACGTDESLSRPSLSRSLITRRPPVADRDGGKRTPQTKEGIKMKTRKLSCVLRALTMLLSMTVFATGTDDGFDYNFSIDEYDILIAVRTQRAADMQAAGYSETAMIKAQDRSSEQKSSN